MCGGMHSHGEHMAVDAGKMKANESQSVVHKRSRRDECLKWLCLFAKVKAITDVTPNELIQVIRLKHAAQLLREGKYRVNEVSYMVGFSSPSYFSKCFTKQFGKKPGEFK